MTNLSINMHSINKIKTTSKVLNKFLLQTILKNYNGRMLYYQRTGTMVISVSGYKNSFPH